MPDLSNTRVREILDRWNVIKNSRSTFNTDCEEIARRIFPAYANSFTQPSSSHSAFGDLGLGTAGRTRAGAYAKDQVDATGANALWKFASVLESMLTPRNSRWHMLKASDKTLMKRRTVQLWFQDLTDTLFSYRENTAANFAGQRFDTYLSIGAFGNGILFTDKMDKRYGVGLRYKSCPVGNVYFCENHQGMVDTVYRVFTRTARQAMQQWGPRVPKKIQEAAKDPKRADAPFSFLHCVSPRTDYDSRRIDINGMLFQSEYLWEHSDADSEILIHEGYHSFPYSVSRYITGPDEIYGRSPAMQVLPSLRLLNEQKKTLLKQSHRAADPPILAHDDGVMNDINMTPGGITYGGVSDDGRALVQPFAVGSPALNKEMMDDERTVILDAFLITVFQLLVETPEMTATEVMERTREKGVLLSPMMGRQQSEALGPQISREVDLIMMQGLMTPMPDLLRQARGNYTIEYDSPLSRAQKAKSASGLFRSIDWVQNYVAATGDKRPLQWINFDEAFPDVLRINGVPARWISDPEQVAGMRQADQQAADGQQMVDAAPALAAMAKTAMGAKQPA